MFVSDCRKEASEAIKNRDFVVSERDKILSEQKSLRTLGDEIRKDRDKNFSKFMGALKDLDEAKQSKIEMQKELKEIRYFSQPVTSIAMF